MTAKLCMVAVIFTLFGLAVGHLVTVTLRPPLGCGEGQLRQLTEDVNLGRAGQAAPKQVHGILRRGTVFEVTWTKGVTSYVRVDLALPTEIVEKASTRVAEARPRVSSGSDVARELYVGREAD